MKYLLCLTTLLLSFTEGLRAHDLTTNQFLDVCGRSILSITDAKAYLRPEKLYFSQGEGLLENDTHQWIPVGEVHRDTAGYYIDINNLECPNGHVGIYRVKRVWYCNEPDCAYFIGENFHH